MNDERKLLNVEEISRAFLDTLSFALGDMPTHDILVREQDMEYFCELTRKLNWLTQDINYMLRQDFALRSTIVYTLSIIVWLNECCDEIYKLFDKPREKGGFKYSRSKELAEADDEFHFLRSLLIAHQLKTDKHAKYGYNGNIVVIDIASDIDGMSKARIGTKICDKADFYVLTYHKDINESLWDAFCISNVLRSLRLKLDRMFEFSKYMRKRYDQ